MKGHSRFVQPGDLEVANKKRRLRSFGLPQAPSPPTQETKPPTAVQETAPPTTQLHHQAIAMLTYDYCNVHFTVQNIQKRMNMTSMICRT
ncbi:hypothetical protein A2U01_0037470, partial [Trifolium medium]|nr:hypothetical protein [Trifolium medium]